MKFPRSIVRDIEPPIPQYNEINFIKSFFSLEPITTPYNSQTTKKATASIPSLGVGVDVCIINLLSLSVSSSIAEIATVDANNKFIAKRLYLPPSSVSSVFIFISQVPFVMLRINLRADTHGHLMGDKVLTKLGDILKINTRSIDIAARWGGEEFAIIFPETDLNGAKTFAERLRRKVENYDFGFQVTISLGIVSTSDELSLDELLTQADEALYAAKEKRNIVVTYSKLRYCET